LPEQAGWQLLPNRYSKAQFDALPDVSPAFFQQRLYLASHRHRHLQADRQVQILLNAPHHIIATAQLRSQGQDLPRTYTLVQQRNGQLSINVTFPQAGNYELRIFAKDRRQEGLYSSVVSYQITASQGGVEFPETYRDFTEHNAVLQSPLTRALPRRELVPFSLSVPNAEEVQVVDRQTGEWTKLQRSGSEFSGQVATEGGNVLVLAKLAGSDHYVSLLSYE
jgi:transglutaminase/protease-like cytokinesis protein 3